MSNIAIRVEHLSKQYKIGAALRRHDSLRDHLTDWAKSLFTRNGRGSLQSAERLGLGGHPSSVDGRSDTIWALKDVSFEVKHGEVVGIIGCNGAGKSTLLKILSRITEPTTGFADIQGRVGSLLEVGTGFHRDLTGRENVYLNGAILGMRKAEINRKFDEIVDFAEIEKFVDTPVKHYSSGMYVRLAFAVSIHLDPEILIVDEVLAVGDAAFQRKCLAKMDEASKGGRTVLFVSHNMQAVNTLCCRAILLNGGRLEQNGNVSAVVKAYLSSVEETYPEQLEQTWNDFGAAPGNDKIRLRRINIVPNSDKAERLIDLATSFVIEIEFWNLSPQNPLIVALSFHTEQNVAVLITASNSDPKWNDRFVPSGLFRTICYVPEYLLNDGLYKVGLYFVGSSGLLYENPKAVSFTVHDLEPRILHYYGKIHGVVRPRLKWQTELVSDGSGSKDDSLSELLP